MSDSRFKASQFNVKAESEKEPEVRVVKAEAHEVPSVRGFSMQDLHSSAAAAAQAKLTRQFANAGHASPSTVKQQKDKRFALNQLVRGTLAVDEEEKRQIDERVREGVAAVSAEARKKGFDAGYADGIKKGHDEAFAKFKSDAEPRLRALEELVRAFDSAKDELYRANEQFLIEMVFRVGRMVLLRDLTTDREYLHRLTRDLIERIGLRENITIRISPQDKESIGMLKEGLDRSFGGLKNLTIETSNQIRLGGCMVETEWNAIDASVETQLKGIHEALIGTDGASNAGGVQA